MERFEEIFELLNSRYIPELQLIIKDNAVLMCMAAFVIIMVFVGRQRGFIDRVLSLGSVIMTLAAEIKLFPRIMEGLKGNEAVGAFFLNMVRGWMNTGKDSPAAVSPLYELLGLDVLAENAADLMETLAVKVICFVLVFIVLRIVFRAAAYLAKGLKRIRLIDSVDRLLGMLLGFSEAFVFIWIFMLVVSGLPNIPFCSYVLKQIMHNDILLAVYNQNLLFLFVADLLG